MDWESHRESLIIWAEQNHYHVNLVKNGDDAVCWISKIIEINSSKSMETQVIRLAHECGHVLIFKNGSVIDFREKQSASNKTVSYKVYTVIEEVEAWKRGRELVRRLAIPIDDSRWEKDMVSALKKYINWASDLKK